MRDSEKLYIAQAIYKKVADQVSTRNPDGLRARADAVLMDAYETTGAKTFDALVNGKKVGTYSVSLSKGAKARKVTTIAVRDPDQVAAYAIANPDDLARFLSENAQQVAEWFFKDSGSIADGVDVTVQEVPATNPRPTKTVLKISPAKVGEALQGQLPEAIAGLLGDGAK